MRAKSRKGASTTVTAVADNPRQPLSAARVAAPLREETARSMRFRIAKLSINRFWVNCDQSGFWFQNPRKTPFTLCFPHEAPVLDLGCPCLVRGRVSH
jgi:hypothetical protein